MLKRIYPGLPAKYYKDFHIAKEQASYNPNKRKARKAVLLGLSRAYSRYLSYLNTTKVEPEENVLLRLIDNYGVAANDIGLSSKDLAQALSKVAIRSHKDIRPPRRSKSLTIASLNYGTYHIRPEDLPREVTSLLKASGQWSKVSDLSRIILLPSIPEDTFTQTFAGGAPDAIASPSTGVVELSTIDEQTVQIHPLWRLLSFGLLPNQIKLRLTKPAWKIAELLAHEADHHKTYQRYMGMNNLAFETVTYTFISD